MGEMKCYIWLFLLSAEFQCLVTIDVKHEEYVDDDDDDDTFQTGKTFLQQQIITRSMDGQNEYNCWVRDMSVKQ